MTVLDLGCGEGTPLNFFEVMESDGIISMDTRYAAVCHAHKKFRRRNFILGSAMAIPLACGSIERVVSNVALPYMNIPQTLKEVYRVLAADGSFTASLHPWAFTVSELRKSRSVNTTLHHLAIMGNGILFHLVGWAPRESFQTIRGMRIALKRAGFQGAEFRRPNNLALWVTAHK